MAYLQRGEYVIRRDAVAVIGTRNLEKLMAYRLEVFRDKGLLKRWRWRRRAGNGRVTETAGQSYFSKWNAKRAAHKAHPADPIQEVM